MCIRDRLAAFWLLISIVIRFVYPSSVSILGSASVSYSSLKNFVVVSLVGIVPTY